MTSTKGTRKNSTVVESIAALAAFFILLVAAQSASAQPITPTLKQDSSVGIGFLARDSVEPAQNATTANITQLATILPFGNQSITPMQFTPQIQGQDQEEPTSDDESDDIVILSHRFDEGTFSSEVIGEVLNNDTRSYDKFDITIFANFRDPAGNLVSSEEGFIDAETLGVGDSSAFNIFLLDSELPETASTYDLVVNDERLVAGQPLSGGSNGDGGDDDFDFDGGGGGGSDNDDDNDDDGPLEELDDLLDDDGNGDGGGGNGDEGGGDDGEEIDGGDDDDGGDGGDGDDGGGGGEIGFAG